MRYASLMSDTAEPNRASSPSAGSPFRRLGAMSHFVTAMALNVAPMSLNVALMSQSFR